MFEASLFGDNLDLFYKSVFGRKMTAFTAIVIFQIIDCLRIHLNFDGIPFYANIMRRSVTKLSVLDTNAGN